MAAAQRVTLASVQLGFCLFGFLLHYFLSHLISPFDTSYALHLSSSCDLMGCLTTNVTVTDAVITAARPVEMLKQKMQIEECFPFNLI